VRRHRGNEHGPDQDDQVATALFILETDPAGVLGRAAALASPGDTASTAAVPVDGQVARGIYAETEPAGVLGTAAAFVSPGDTVPTAAAPATCCRLDCPCHRAENR
jgi:hypothetical protein